MAFTIFLLFASAYIRAALGGALKVIDYDRQYVIWSDDNHGCIGYSRPCQLPPFGPIGPLP